MKPIIGILNNIKTDENEGPYADYYMVNKVYIDKLKKVEGIPLGIFDATEEVLDKCDGFLLIGGHRITTEHYKIIEYAIKNNKPLLGICNGMQAIVLYARLYSECIKSGIEPTISNIYNKYGDLKKEGAVILEKLGCHGGELSSRRIAVFMENLVKFKHDINIKENSILFDIYKKSTINVFSIHSYGFHNVVDTLEVVATTNDNVVEGIKYKDKPIIGVQYHAELDETNELFERFVEKCKQKSS